MLSVLGIGILGVWVISILLVLWLVLSVEAGKSRGSFLLTVGLLSLISWELKLPILTIIKTHPIIIIIYLLSYILIGVIWAIVKWYFFLRKNAHKYEDIKARAAVKGIILDTPESVMRYKNDKEFTWDARLCLSSPG